MDLCSRNIKGCLVPRISRTAEMIQAVDNAILDTFSDLNVNGLRIVLFLTVLDNSRKEL